MSTWALVTYWYTVISLIIFVGFTIVMSIGGFIDLRHLFKELNSGVLDEKDDGRVIEQDDENECAVEVK